MIDYKLLAEAKEFYSLIGYEYIEVPWAIPEEFVYITCPKKIKPDSIKQGMLVGSAEQSFLYLASKGLKGKYQTITPCFRHDKLDALHQPYFMKLELFSNNYQDATLERLSIILDAHSWFDRFVETEPFQTKEGFDIVDATFKIELGSYHINKHPLVGDWICGTGIAEPRLSYVINKLSEV